MNEKLQIHCYINVINKVGVFTYYNQSILNVKEVLYNYHILYFNLM